MTRTRRILYGLAAPVAAVLFAILVSAIVLAASGYSAVDVFKAMWQYTDSTDSVVAIINRAIPFYVSALAVAIGFKMALFNIGVDGQYRLAAVLSAAAGAAVSFPAPLQVSFILAIAIVVGALWAAVAALLKVWRGVSEVISTIMLNSIATGITVYLLANYLRENNDAGDLVTKTPLLPAESFIPPLNRLLEVFGLHLPEGTQLNGFLVGAIILGVGYYFVLWRTRFGFDLRATGSNPAAARAAGVNPKAMIVKTMLSAVASPGWSAWGRCSAIRSSTATPSSSRRPSVSAASRSRSLVATIRWASRSPPSCSPYIERATQVLSLEGIPQEISRIMQGTIILSAVVAYEIVRRIRVAAEVRDAAAKAEPRAAGPVPEPVPA